MLMVISIVNFLSAFAIFTGHHNGLMSLNILSLIYSGAYLFNPRFSRHFRTTAGMQVIKNVILVLMILFIKQYSDPIALENDVMKLSLKSQKSI